LTDGGGAGVAGKGPLAISRRIGGGGLGGLTDRRAR
jgi:hypothetical protein